jgi:hypothetical protein
MRLAFDIIEPREYRRTSMADSKQTAVPQNEWIAKTNMKFFKYLTQQGVVMVPQELALGSQSVVFPILRKQWEVVSQNAYYINITARRRLADRVSNKVYQEEELFKAEQAIGKAFEEAHEYFDRRIAQAEQIFESCGMNPDISAIFRPVYYEALCTTRTATNFLRLLQKAERYLNLNRQLWVLGELSPEKQTEQEAESAMLRNEREVRNQLTAITRTTYKQFQAIRELVTRVEKKREEEEAQRRLAQSERDKAKHKSAAVAVPQEAQADGGDANMTQSGGGMAEAAFDVVEEVNESEAVATVATEAADATQGPVPMVAASRK